MRADRHAGQFRKLRLQVDADVALNREGDLAGVLADRILTQPDRAVFAGFDPD
jgi:hypothetical protein